GIRKAVPTAGFVKACTRGEAQRAGLVVEQAPCGALTCQHRGCRHSFEFSSHAWMIYRKEPRGPTFRHSERDLARHVDVTGEKKAIHPPRQYRVDNHGFRLLRAIRT